MSVAPEPGGVTILGRGRVGCSLGRALEQAGVDVRIVAAREDARSARGRLVVLAVPDEAIGAVADRVATAVGDERPPVVHLSGACGLEPLSALADAGFAVGVLHPFLPFPSVRPPEVFRGATIGIEASVPALESRLDDVARAIGGVPTRVPGDRWSLYHAAAVMASNYLVVLAAQATELLEQAGFDRDGAVRALLPLMSGTLENLAREGLPHALSGPLRRGDAETVERHLRALEPLPEIAATYRALAVPGLELAQGTGLSATDADAIRAVLERD